MTESTVHNQDCLEAMRKMPDNAFDLAVVDPPYGAGFTEGCGCKGWFTKYHQSAESEQGGQPWNRFGGRFDRYKSITFTAAEEQTSETGQNRRHMGGEVCKKIIAWDTAPEQEYFEELFRVSRNQIIWGGNYFALPPARCFLIWRKLSISESFSMAMCEYAWTSFQQNAKMFECAPQGQKDDPRFHPTQKPIALYAWIFQNFAKPGMRILDTHLGSGSSRIAAYDAGLDFVGYEIDKTYFDKAEERFQKHVSQIDLFHLEPQPEAVQQELTFV